MDRRDKLWLKREEALTLTGMKVNAFRARIVASLGEDDTRKTTGRGQALEFWAPAIVQRLVAMAESSGGGDPLLAGGSDSPALERFREARADREELELGIRRKELIDVAEFLQWWDAEIAAPLHKGLEKLQRKFGPDAFDLIATVFRHTESTVSGRFEPEEENSG